MNKPDISVVMPVYNDERFVREAVESVLAQTFKNFELIIVNDGSTDSSGKIINELAAKDPRIKIIANPLPTGRGAARNAGIAAATGEFIAFNDSDDLSLPERLEKHFEFMKNNPDCGFVASNCILADEAGAEVALDKIRPGEKDIVSALRNHCIVCHCASLFRTSLIKGIGGYRAGFAQSQDYDMLLRLVDKTPVRILDIPVYKYRKTRSSVSMARNSAGQACMMLVKKFAAQRARDGRDEYDEYLKAGKIPQTKGDSGRASEAEYNFNLAWNALRCWAYGSCFSRSIKGFVNNPLLVHKLVIMNAGIVAHFLLRTFGLLPWFESKYKRV